MAIILLAAIAFRYLDDKTSGADEPVSPSDTVASGESQQPQAAFAYTCKGMSCDFEDTSEGAGTLEPRLWVFGDGEEIESGQTAAHTYREQLPYRVSLSIVGESGTRSTVTRLVVPAAPPVIDQVSGVAPPDYPFGPHIGSSGGWDLLDPVFTSAHVSPRPATVIEQLNAARADKKSIILLLARSAPNYKNSDGTFSLSKWRSEIDQYAEIDFTPWIEDGTLLAHYLISEPMARSRWGGEVITVEVLDEMARYSKERWPTLATVVREQPTDLITHAGGYETGVSGWRWSYLDAGWARYSARMGPIDEYIQAEVRAARSQNLGLLFGLNVLAGGDGSSEKVGYEGGWLMSPDELMDYGTKIIAEPYGCGNIMWHLNHDGIPYFGDPEIDVVVEELAQMARSREPIPCSVSEPSS